MRGSLRSLSLHVSEQVTFTTGAVARSHQSNAAAPSRSPLLPGHDENVVEEEEVDVMPGRPLEEDAAVFHVGGQLPPLDHPPGGRHQREGLGEEHRENSNTCMCVHGGKRGGSYTGLQLVPTLLWRMRARLSRLAHRLHRYWPSKLPWRCCTDASACLYTFVSARVQIRAFFLQRIPLLETALFSLYDFSLNSEHLTIC